MQRCPCCFARISLFSRRVCGTARRTDQKMDPVRVRRVSRGSGVIYQGQGSTWRTRNSKVAKTPLNPIAMHMIPPPSEGWWRFCCRNESRQLTMLQRQMTLGAEEIARIRRIFVSLTDSADPSITFGRFLAVLKAIGISGEGEAELDFFAKLYKVFDSDGNGKVEFTELIDGLHLLSEGSAKEKLQMYFNMFATVGGCGDML